MIGLGKWAISIDTMMFRGDAVLVIADKDGAYDFSVEVKGLTVPEYEVVNVQEDGNTLTGAIKTVLLPGKEIPITLTFEGDILTGFAKVPLLGKIKFKNGHKVG